LHTFLIALETLAMAETYAGKSSFATLAMAETYAGKSSFATFAMAETYAGKSSFATGTSIIAAFRAVAEVCVFFRNLSEAFY
jgi:hypothetical protein